MNAFISCFILALFTMGATLCAKRSSGLVVGNPVVGNAFYLILVGVSSCVSYVFVSGFTISINVATCLYSILYACICTVSMVSAIIAYKLMATSGVTVIQKAASVLSAFFLGWLLFGEQILPLKIVQLVFMLGAVAFVFLNQKQAKKATDVSLNESQKTPSPIVEHRWTKLAVILLLLILSTGSSTTITKYYVLDSRVTNYYSFCFFTNAFIALGSIVVVAFIWLKDRKQITPSLSIFKPSKMINVVGNVICNSAAAPFNLWLLSNLELSIYTLFTSAIGILSGVAVSLLLKEKQGVWAYLAALFAIVALCL